MSEPVGDIVGIVLAAGASRRMGAGRNKLLEEVAGRPIVAAPISALEDAGLPRIVVVVGHEAERLRAAMRQRPALTFVENPRWEEGMGSSLAAAARAIAEDDAGSVAGVLVVVGDLPRLDAAVVRPVVDAFRSASSPGRICLPVFEGRDGHPVLFGARHFPALAALRGDRGARAVIDAHEAETVRVEVAHDGILRDVDTPEALASARAR